MEPESRATFTNNVDYCVGTGRIGLALQKEYQEPTHAEFAGQTAWSLLNAWNHTCKKLSPQRQVRSISRFRQLLMN